MSVSFYNQHAASFVADTLNVDMSELYQRFLPLLPAGAHIIDAGCGSGRDTKFFSEQGFIVTAFDASSELAALASKYTGLQVVCTDFLRFTSPQPANAIWACASLLHVPAAELTLTLAHLAKQLVAGGLFYCSFKLGAADNERAGRQFTNMDLARLNTFLPETGLIIRTVWCSNDARPDRQAEQWFNVILEKAR